MINNLMLITYLITYIPIIVIFAIMPYIVRRNVFFGITAPRDYYTSDTAKTMRRSYTIKIIILGFITSMLSYLSTFYLEEKMQSIIMMVAMFLLLSVMASVYYSMYKKAKEIKITLKWDEITEATVITDTSFFTKKIALSPWWFVLYGVIIVFTIWIGIALYDKIPNEVPVKTDMNGVVTYAQKSYKLMLNTPIIQIIMAAIFIFVYYTLKIVRPELDSNQVDATVEQNRKHRYAWSIFTVFTGMVLLLVFLLIQMQFIGIISVQMALYLSLAVAFLILISAIVIAVKLGQSGSRIKVIQDGDATKTIDRQDDKYWKMGMYYVNKDDPSLFVEKRFGVGYTMNFAKPLGWIILGVVIVVVIGSIIIGK